MADSQPRCGRGQGPARTPSSLHEDPPRDCRRHRRPDHPGPGRRMRVCSAHRRGREEAGGSEKSPGQACLPLPSSSNGPQSPPLSQAPGLAAPRPQRAARARARRLGASRYLNPPGRVAAAPHRRGAAAGWSPWYWRGRRATERLRLGPALYLAPSAVRVHHQ